MRFLLDTHVFLWALFSPAMLGSEARSALESAENDIFLSVVSLWEISLKFALGKLELSNVSTEELPALAREMDIGILPLTPEQAAEFHKLPRRKHRDPFDRMIVWQSLDNGLVLISRDRSLGEYDKLGLNRIW